MKARYRLWKTMPGLVAAAGLLVLLLAGCATVPPADLQTDGDLTCQDRYRECMEKCRGLLQAEKRNCEIQCSVELDACLRRHSSKSDKEKPTKP